MNGNIGESCSVYNASEKRFLDGLKFKNLSRAIHFCSFIPSSILSNCLAANLGSMTKFLPFGKGPVDQLKHFMAPHRLCLLEMAAVTSHRIRSTMTSFATSKGISLYVS